MVLQNENADTTPAPVAADVVLARWDFPEHETHERGWWWYLIAGIVALAVLYYAYRTQNPLFGVIVVLSGIIFAVTEYRGPDFHVFAITEDGVIAGLNFYKYSELQNFYLIYDPPRVKKLYVKPRSLLRPWLTIPLMDEDPNRIRTLLKKNLPEDLEKEEEPVSDYFGRMFKF